MEDTLTHKIEQLTEQIKLLELTCIKLEAERDAHMEVIKEIFLTLMRDHEGHS